jgi:hypothetical protein
MNLILITIVIFLNAVNIDQNKKKDLCELKDDSTDKLFQCSAKDLKE